MCRCGNAPRYILNAFASAKCHRRTAGIARIRRTFRAAAHTNFLERVGRRRPWRQVKDAEERLPRSTVRERIARVPLARCVTPQVKQSRCSNSNSSGFENSPEGRPGEETGGSDEEPVIQIGVVDEFGHAALDQTHVQQGDDNEKGDQLPPVGQQPKRVGVSNLSDEEKVAQREQEDGRPADRLAALPEGRENVDRDRSVEKEYGGPEQSPRRLLAANASCGFLFTTPQGLSPVGLHSFSKSD